MNNRYLAGEEVELVDQRALPHIDKKEASISARPPLLLKKYTK